MIILPCLDWFINSHCYVTYVLLLMFTFFLLFSLIRGGKK